MTAPFTFSSAPVDSKRANAGVMGFRRTAAERDAAVARGSYRSKALMERVHESCRNAPPLARCGLAGILTALDSRDANILEALCVLLGVEWDGRKADDAGSVWL